MHVWKDIDTPTEASANLNVISNGIVANSVAATQR